MKLTTKTKMYLIFQTVISISVLALVIGSFVKVLVEFL